MYLNHEQLETVVELTPLVSIDLFIVNAANEVLVGYRNNRPAQGYWFVPGGRILKNETFEQAFTRISQSEIGFAMQFANAKPLGAYQHFYPDSRFGEHLSTHYVALGFLVKLEAEVGFSVSDNQHSDLKWIPLDVLDADESVHEMTKAYLSAVRQLLFES